MTDRGRNEGAQILETTRVIRADGAAFRQVDGKAFIVGARSNKLVMLNDTGSAVWGYLNDPATVGDLSRRLEQDFQVDRDTARADCQGFLSQLASRELVVLEWSEEG